MQTNSPPIDDQDHGLIRRGLILLALMTALVGVVLYIVFQGSGSSLPTEDLGRGVEPSAPGWEIRFTSAATLARLGSDKVPWPLLGEMLDEPRQMRNFRVKLEDGRDVADEVAARTTMLSALKAVAEWHHKQRERKTTEVPAAAKAVYAQVDQLAQSSIPDLKVQAEKTRATFFR